MNPAVQPDLEHQIRYGGQGRLQLTLRSEYFGRPLGDLAFEPPLVLL